MAARTALNTILRGSPKTARTSRVNAIAFIPGMTVPLSLGRAVAAPIVRAGTGPAMTTIKISSSLRIKSASDVHRRTAMSAMQNRHRKLQSRASERM
jgi:hypothetical protein